MYKDYYRKADRYSKYVHSLLIQAGIQVAIRTLGGRNTRACREALEKYEKVNKKLEKMYDDASNKAKLDSTGINTQLQRDLELYKEIQNKVKKARKKNMGEKNRNLKEKPS